MPNRPPIEKIRERHVRVEAGGGLEHKHVVDLCDYALSLERASAPSAANVGDIAKLITRMRNDLIPQGFHIEYWDEFKKVEAALPGAADGGCGAETLPYICPDHPMAQVRHSWDQSHYVMNGYPSGQGTKSNHKYECAECGRELAGERTTGGRDE